MTRFHAVKAVAFDCFGTLVHFSLPPEAFARVLESRRRHDLPARDVMRRRWTLFEAAEAFEANLGDAELLALQERLDAEIASVELFPETRDTLLTLREQGYRVAVCSNLAMPYARAVDRLVSDLIDARTWSFNVGATKPSPVIYSALCESVRCPPAEVLMVGDSLHADYQGALDAGLAALHLVRTGSPSGMHQVRTLAEVPAMLKKC
ncbi:HAD family hydrolase [Paraburkholderia sp. UCT31]|uniref:HAD family hydrolase n=1 Tax=Paraburkholderia sp. UCT31 TaxID=2615209 RepID=UPI001654EE6A|nr:HAD family hydrolase [Paraburkholderia sp. UCT31]MBC8739748.1 HAD family hydrolase [Paraburkholderia sp. UCT31]